MNYNTSVGEQISTAASVSVLKNAYLLLSLTLLPTILGAFLGVRFSWSFLPVNPIFAFLVLMGVMYGFTFLIAKNQNSSSGVYLLLLFTFCMGMLLGPLLQFTLALKNGASLISYAAGITALIFFGLSSWIQATGKDLTGLGKFMFVGALVLVSAVLANAFLQIPALSLAITALIALFSCLGIAHNISQAVNGGQTNYIMLTLSLYLDLFNLFVSLLRLLTVFSGQQRD